MISRNYKTEALKDNIESPANIVHFLKNDSQVNARILVTKAPRPENKTRML